MKEIFTLTTFSIKGRAKCMDRPRVVGWFETKEQAVAYIESESSLHLWEEGFYTHLLVERVSPGVYPETKDVAWYFWDKKRDGWTKIYRPQQFENTCNFSIG